MTHSSRGPGADGVLLPLPRLGGPGRRPPRSRATTDGLSLAQLSNLLWAAFGSECHGSGGRVPGSRRCGQALQIHVCLPEGCFRYDATEHALVLVSRHDGRAWAGWHGAGEAPSLAFAYVTAGASEHDEETGRSACDVPTVAAHVAAGAAAAGLVARGEDWFHPGLATLLALRPTQRIALTQSVFAGHAVH